MVPARLNDPFDSLPHPLIVCEAERLHQKFMELIAGEPQGKMFGVLLVRDRQDRLQSLFAFSGSIAGRYNIDGFVPPIFELPQEVDSLYSQGQRRIDELKQRIIEAESDPQYISLQHRLEALQEEQQVHITTLREHYRLSKSLRGERRRAATTPEELSAIERESQHQKGEIRRAERGFRERLNRLNEELCPLSSHLEELRRRRRGISQELQRWIYDNFIITNGRGERRSLYTIFEQHNGELPPTGAGECAAPKLLHYAISMGYTPLSIGEFWVGAPPRGEVRHDGEFYEACRGRCLPILRFMLEGVDVEWSSRGEVVDKSLDIIYEDDDIIAVNKPSGMLSVDGAEGVASIDSIVREIYPLARVAHRLDQDTSGILLVAKGVECYRSLQQQFVAHTIQKEYIALVDGVVSPPKGSVSLPLRADPLERPRQVVDFVSGKSAHSDYEVVEITPESYTRLRLTPHTGRTHQLRLHCAHPEGLSAPILGDRLYGRAAGERRLHLHAERITLLHPTTAERITLRSPAPF